MKSPSSQKGFLMIVAVVLLVVIAFLAVMLSSLGGVNATSGASHLGSMQALYEADSGLEFEQRRWAQTPDPWYRSATDPNPIAPVAQALGTGSFSVNTYFPATLALRKLDLAVVTLNVYTTQRFPSTGILQIGDDLTAVGEFVSYTGTTATTFTGLTRGVTVGGVPSIANAHARGATVYPVTTLVDALTNNCNTVPNPFRIVAHSKFLSAGTIDIEGEEIGYNSSTVAGGNMTLTGVRRCLDLVTPVTPAAHTAGRPVTPVLVGGDSADYQAEMVSIGTTGSNIRDARRTVQR